MNGPTHLHFETKHPRHPEDESRPTAFAWCGAYEECSPSGKHGMATEPGDTDCWECREEYEQARFDEWVDSRLDEAEERDLDGRD